MRFLLMSLAVGILCLCGVTLAEEVTAYSVLLSSLKDIKDGLFIFPVTTDTILKNIRNKTLFLSFIDGTTIEAEIMINNESHLFINNEPNSIKLLSHEKMVNLTEYNISHLLRPRGMNELRIRQLTLYKLHPETGLVDTHLHTIETTKYFHLYLFERPRIHRSGNSLLCSLNDTGIGEYENWLVKFFKEDHNESVGVCVKDDDSVGDVYYDKNKHACVLKLEKETNGTYSCSLFVRHVEMGKIKLECHEKINVKNTSQELPLTMIVVSVVCVGILIILVIFVLPTIAIAKCRSHRKPEIQPQRRARGDYESLAGRQRPNFIEDEVPRSATPMSIMSEPEQESDIDFDQRRLDLSSPNPPSLDFNNPRSLKLPDSSSGSTSPERDQRPAAAKGAQDTRVKGKKKRKKGAQPLEQRETEDK